MKKTVLALLLAACLLLTGCNLIEKDAEVDKGTTILSINGVTIDKQTFTTAYNNYVNQYAYLYYSLGSSYDEKANRETARQTVADGLVANEVRSQKAKELGFFDFSDEDKASIEASAKEAYEADRATIQTQYFPDTELTGDELIKALDDKMNELGYTLDNYQVSEEHNFGLEKLRADAVKDVAVTEDEIKTQFDTNVASYKQSYDSNPASYGSYVNSFTSPDSFAYYAPEGFRYVKRILFQFNDADKTTVTAKSDEISAKQTAISTIQSNLDNLDAEAENYEADKADFESQLTQMNAELDALNADYKTLLSNAATGIMEAVDAASQRITAGESFDAVMDELGTDARLKAEPLKTRGYAVSSVSTDLDADLVAAAMQIKLPGETAVYTGKDGVSIVQYVAAVPAGAIDISVASKTISDSLLSTKQGDAYTAKTDEWVAAAKVEKYLDRLD